MHTTVVAVGRNLQQGICIRQDFGAKAQQQQLGLPGVPTGQHGLASSCAPAVGVVLCCCGGIHEALVASCESACSTGQSSHELTCLHSRARLAIAFRAAFARHNGSMRIKSQELQVFHNNAAMKGQGSTAQALGGVTWWHQGTPDGLLQQVSTLINIGIIRDGAIAAVWGRCSCMRQHQDAVEPESSSDSVGDCPQHRNVALVTPHLCSKPEVLT